MDIDPNAPNVHIVHDLNVVPWPIESDSFDEIHAYEVLEHIGKQGDFRAFFDHMFEIWRILKPNGLIYISCPQWQNKWVWADPGHTRCIDIDTLSFCDMRFYGQIGETSATDYRWYWKGDLQVIGHTEFKGAMCYIGKAIK